MRFADRATGDRSSVIGMLLDQGSRTDTGSAAAPDRGARSTQAIYTSVSTLAAAADVALDCSVAQEACSLGLAPTASTTTMLALGDALAVTLSEKRGFKEEDFANLAPRRKAGEEIGSGGIVDAYRRCAASGCAADKDAGCDL